MNEDVKTDDPLVLACEERDETRRWLMEIALQLGVPASSQFDYLVTAHEAWDALHHRIMQHLKPTHRPSINRRKGMKKQPITLARLRELRALAQAAPDDSVAMSKAGILELMTLAEHHLISMRMKVKSQPTPSA